MRIIGGAIDAKDAKQEELFGFMCINVDLLATQEEIANLFGVSRQAVAKWRIEPIGKLLIWNKDSHKFTGEPTKAEYYFLPEVMLYWELRGNHRNGKRHR